MELMLTVPPRGSELYASVGVDTWETHSQSVGLNHALPAPVAQMLTVHHPEGRLSASVSRATLAIRTQTADLILAPATLVDKELSVKIMAELLSANAPHNTLETPM